MSRRRVIVVGAALLGGLVAFRLYQEWAGGGGPAGGRAFGGGRPGDMAQLVEVALPLISTINERVSLVGSLRAKQRVDVTPKFSGRVVEIRVDRGDVVRAGQVVARLEDDELRQQVRRAEAALQVARASVAQREAELEGIKVELERFANLAKDGVVSSQQLEQAETRVQVTQAQTNLAKAQVSQAEAELEELRIRVGQTEILSPLSGAVGQRYVDPGALVSSSTPILMVLDLATLVTVVNVPERQINKVQAGTEAKITVDAVSDETFSGHVVRISPILDSQSRTAPVEIELANPTGQLKAEMFARVDLNLTAEREALLIPREALVYRSNRPGVFLVEAEEARFQPVETGLTDGNQVEILSGLSDQDLIVSRGANLLKDRDKIRIMSPEGV